MKQKILLILALILSVDVNAQSLERQVLGASGSSYSGASMQVDYTVGEAATITGTAGSFTVSQGFQQNPANTTAIKEQSVLVNYSLYPNPAQDQVTLSINAAASFALKVSVSNVAGQILLADQQAEEIAQTYKRTIPIQAFATGVYFVNLYDDKNGLLQSIRFVKQ
jgi:hypothetical protein